MSVLLGRQAVSYGCVAKSSPQLARVVRVIQPRNDVRGLDYERPDNVAG